MNQLLNLERYLTPNEMKTRKKWLWAILSVFALFFVASGLAIIGNLNSKQNDLIFTSIASFVMFTAMLWLAYHFCYKKHTTFLLTLYLISGILGVFAQLSQTLLASLAGGTAGLISMLCFAPFLFVELLFLKWALGLRRINKILKCHAKYPVESDEVIREFRCVSDLESLSAAFIKYGKFPHLRSLVDREWSLKKKELKKHA